MDKEPPRDVLRDGNLKASIWRNEGEKGQFYSASLARTYQDDQGELRDAHSFAGTELLRVAELARKAYDRTQELRREDRAQAPTQDVQHFHQSARPQQQALPMSERQSSQANSTPATPQSEQARNLRQEFMDQRQAAPAGPTQSHNRQQ